MRINRNVWKIINLSRILKKMRITNDFNELIATKMKFYEMRK